MAVFKESFMSQKGFDELRKYIKHGSDFSKDLQSILQERAELEDAYGKGLQKLSTRLSKSSRELIGSSGFVWQEVAVAMESESELHKNLANDLREDISKQLKILGEIQQKTRKQIEASVDKANRILIERRNEEQKVKKQSCVCAKENEKLQESVLDARSQRGSKNLSEKELSKLEQKRRKTEENLNKCDQEYFGISLRAERARQNWGLTVLKAEEQFQLLEEERLSRLQDFAEKYRNHLSLIGPNLVENCGRLNEAIKHLDLQRDLVTVIDTKGTGPYIPEQFLPDYYAEDLGSAMNKDRRKDLLEKYLQMVRQALELEKKGQQGIRTLSRGLSSHFNDSANQQEIAAEMLHMEATQNFLEAFQLKVQCIIADIESKSRPTHPLSGYMEQNRDKQGVIHVILKVPWSGLQGNLGCLPDHREEIIINSTNRPIQSHRRTSSDYQEDLQCHGNTCQTIGRCRALYVYDGTEGDELTIRPGRSSVHTCQRRQNVCPCGTSSRCTGRRMSGGMVN